MGALQVLSAEQEADPDAGPDGLSLALVLGALSDPIRLAIVSELADGSERSCGSFDLGIAKSTRSHHFNVLVEAGILTRRVEGRIRKLKLRRDALEARFPGLLDAVLGGSRR
ncbi:MAG: helix-turn-helix transcriptional regulator [Solirubrobacterales bacterium]|nr:helix-turn-helix transcriptional regulator [Solirubrobacterales bacterium]